MSITALQAVRTRLMADVALNAFWTARYGHTARQFIGYKKPVNANDFPAISYVPVRDRVGEQPFGKATVSIIVSLNEKELVGDVFDGLVYSDAAAQLIVNSLLAIDSPISIENGTITVTTDLGMGHPFYETELQFAMWMDQADVDASALNDFVTFHADYDIDSFAGGTEHGKWLQEPPDHTTSAPDLTDTTTLPQ